MSVTQAISLLMSRRIIYSSDSDSSSDDDWEEILQERGKRQIRPRIEDYTQVVDRYMDHEFKSHFRMSRATFEFVLETIGHDLIRNMKGCPTIPPSQQLMIAIWKMATIDSYRSVCDRFNVGRATAVRAVRRVTKALFRVAPQFIQWPIGDRALAIMRGFEESSGFPKVIGAIDGTHIRINAPNTSHVDYINRKGYHSIQLQLVCDHRTTITHCYTGHPGSVHDQRVFRQSEVSSYLGDEQRFPGDSHLLGDAAYELHQNLLTPFRDNGHLSEAQKNYNYRQSSARMPIERSIGLLKTRWRSLLHCLPLTRVDLMAQYIVACCVLHNICNLRQDEIDVVTIPSLPDQSVREAIIPQVNRQHAGVQKRNVIMNTLTIN